MSKRAFTAERYFRFEESSEYLRALSRSWDAKLKEAFPPPPPPPSLPPIAWSANWDDVEHRQN